MTLGRWREEDITSTVLLSFSAESEIRRLQLQESLDQRTIQALQAENQRLRQELAKLRAQLKERNAKE